MARALTCQDFSSIVKEICDGPASCVCPGKEPLCLLSPPLYPPFPWENGSANFSKNISCVSSFIPCSAGATRSFWRWSSTAGGFSNRGVLFGPYCPVYGVGALLFLLLFYRLIQGKPWKQRLLWLPLLFVGCMVSATLVELGASLSLPGTDRELALADLCQLPLPFSGADRPLPPLSASAWGGLFFLYVLQPLLDRGLAALSPRAGAGWPLCWPCLWGLTWCSSWWAHFLNREALTWTPHSFTRNTRLPWPPSSPQLPDPGLRIAVRQQGGPVFPPVRPGRLAGRRYAPLPGPYRLVQRPLLRQRPSPGRPVLGTDRPGRWVHRPFPRPPFSPGYVPTTARPATGPPGPFWIPWPPR